MIARRCERCAAPFEAQRTTGRYCSANCRKAASKRRLSPRPPPPSASTSAAVRAELAAAGRLGTYLGEAALALADRIDSTRAVMGFAAMVKELRATMDAAMAGAAVSADPVDELRMRRDGIRAVPD